MRDDAKILVDDLAALRQFIRDEHGPIGWEYQLGVMQERAGALAARVRELEAAVSVSCTKLRDSDPGLVRELEKLLVGPTRRDA